MLIEILHKIAVKYNKPLSEVESIINYQFRKAKAHVWAADKRRFYMKYLFSIYFNFKTFDFVMNLRVKKLNDIDIKDELELEQLELEEYRKEHYGTDDLDYEDIS